MALAGEKHGLDIPLRWMIGRTPRNVPTLLCHAHEYPIDGIKGFRGKSFAKRHGFIPVLHAEYYKIRCRLFPNSFHKLRVRQLFDGFFRKRHGNPSASPISETENGLAYAIKKKKKKTADTKSTVWQWCARTFYNRTVYLIKHNSSIVYAPLVLRCYYL